MSELIKQTMDQSWNLFEIYRETEVEEYFRSLDSVFACSGELISLDPISSVKKVSVGSEWFYIKTYSAGGKMLRRYIGRSRVRAEWENLLFFQALKIPTAELVGYGEERRFGIFRRGALITKQIPDSMDLDRWVRRNPNSRPDRKWFSAVIHQVAGYIRTLHDARFAHNDLNWRNIMISQSDNPKVYFIDCPSGQIWMPPLLSRRIIKDLAHLDKVAREVLPKTSQLEFYKSYMGCKRLSKSDKRFIQKILTYHNKHRERKKQRPTL